MRNDLYSPMAVFKKKIMVTMLRCERCGYQWQKRGKNLPEVCANLKCKSRYWNKPRRNKKKVGSNEKGKNK